MQCTATPDPDSAKTPCQLTIQWEKLRFAFFQWLTHQQLSETMAVGKCRTCPLTWSFSFCVQACESRFSWFNLLVQHSLTPRWHKKLSSSCSPVIFWSNRRQFCYMFVLALLFTRFARYIIYNPHWGALQHFAVLCGAEVTNFTSMLLAICALHSSLLACVGWHCAWFASTHKTADIL